MVEIPTPSSLTKFPAVIHRPDEASHSVAEAIVSELTCGRVFRLNTRSTMTHQARMRSGSHAGSLATSQASALPDPREVASAVVSSDLAEKTKALARGCELAAAVSNCP